MNIQLFAPLRDTKIDEALFKDKSKNFKIAFLQFCYKPTEIIYLCVCVYVYIVFLCFAMHTDFYPISTLTINNITVSLFCSLKAQTVSRLRLAHLSVE